MRTLLLIPLLAIMTVAAPSAFAMKNAIMICQLWRDQKEVAGLMNSVTDRVVKNKGRFDADVTATFDYIDKEMRKPVSKDGKQSRCQAITLTQFYSDYKFIDWSPDKTIGDGKKVYPEYRFLAYKDTYGKQGFITDTDEVRLAEKYIVELWVVTTAISIFENTVTGKTIFASVNPGRTSTLIAKHPNKRRD